MKKITCKRRHIFASAIKTVGGPQNYGGIPISTVDMGTGVPKTTVLWGRGSPNLRCFGDGGPQIYGIPKTLGNH